MVERRKRWQHRVEVARTAIAQSVDEHHGGGIGGARFYDKGLSPEDGLIHDASPVAGQRADRVRVEFCHQGRHAILRSSAAAA